MEKPRRQSLTELPMLSEIGLQPLAEELTALGGVPLVLRAFRSLGLPVAIREHVQIKQRERGYDEATCVESSVVLNAVGGECVEDMERLRDDTVLSKLLGHDFPSPRGALGFLYQFHDEQKMAEAKGRRAPEEIAYIPEESAPLQGLGRVNRSLMQELGSRCAEQRIARVDQDATIIESRKQEALRTYEGERGYQPKVVVWAETDVVLADQFREGNVAGMMQPLTAAKAAFAALPGTVKTYYYRGDSACHESGLVNWLRDEKRADGPQGFIGFAISARLSEAPQEAMLGLTEEAWKPNGEPHPEEVRECAEVPFVPGEKSEHKGTGPLRYVGSRIRKRQGGLFEEGLATRHFALVSNIWDWKAGRLVEWHRERAGTIEAVQGAEE
jgi:hypothetical protein